MANSIILLIVTSQNVKEQFIYKRIARDTSPPNTHYELRKHDKDPNVNCSHSFLVLQTSLFMTQPIPYLYRCSGLLKLSSESASSQNPKGLKESYVAKVLYFRKTS